MQIIVLHGPGEVAKRLYLSRIKTKFSSDEIQIVDFKQSSLSTLQTLLSSLPLFADQRLVVVENVPYHFDLQALQQSDERLTLVIVAGASEGAKPLYKSAQKMKAQVVVFEGDKERSSFPFLDALIERRPEAFRELAGLLEEYGSMYILSMIYYLLRRNQLPLPASAFIRQKISQQKQAWSPQHWQRLYALTLETEYALKTGGMEDRVALTNLVQQFLLTK